MGDVDRTDQNIATYRIATKTKKWWWAFFVWIRIWWYRMRGLLYRIHKEAVDPNLDLLAFRREIVDVYLKRYVSRSRYRNGRLKGRILPAKRRVNDEIRFDRIDHFSTSLVKQKSGLCGKNTRKGCSKCGVGIHDHCFTEWHGVA